MWVSKPLLFVLVLFLHTLCALRTDSFSLLTDDVRVTRQSSSSGSSGEISTAFRGEKKPRSLSRTSGLRFTGRVSRNSGVLKVKAPSAFVKAGAKDLNRPSPQSVGDVHQSSPPKLLGQKKNLLKKINKKVQKQQRRLKEKEERKKEIERLTKLVKKEESTHLGKLRNQVTFAEMDIYDCQDKIADLELEMDQTENITSEMQKKKNDLEKELYNLRGILTKRKVQLNDYEKFLPSSNDSDEQQGMSMDIYKVENNFDPFPTPIENFFGDVSIDQRQFNIHGHKKYEHNFPRDSPIGFGPLRTPAHVPALLMPPQAEGAKTAQDIQQEK